jgi:uncharacterized membrane protein
MNKRQTASNRNRLKDHADLHPNRRTSKTADDLTYRNVQTIARLEEAAKGKQEAGEEVAAKITAFCGSYAFVWVHIFWFGGWTLANLIPPTSWRFDPLPFPFLTLVVSLEAIFLSTFILITQNREAKLNERRAHLDLQVNLLSEQENTKMLELLQNIAVKLGVAAHEDTELRALQQPTSPEKLLDQIEKTIGDAQKTA